MAELVYGASGSGKTSWCLQIAEEIWKTKHLKTRWYLGDGGGETINASGMIEDGIVEVFEYITHDFPFETTMRICQGWWPQDPKNPSSKLIPPPSNLAALYGMHVFEGLNVMAGYMMGDTQGGLRERQAHGEKIKEAGIQFVDGDMKFATNSAANYGTAQEQMLTRIEESRALPGWIQWTAHQTLAEEKKKLGKRDDPNAPVISAGIEYGPAIAGQALTPAIGASFGNTIHLHPATKKVHRTDAQGRVLVDPDTKLPVDEIEIVYRAYTRRHPDPHMKSIGVTYYANSRLPPAYADMMPEYIAPPNAIEFYRILAEAKAKAREARSKPTPVLA